MNLLEETSWPIVQLETVQIGANYVDEDLPNEHDKSMRTVAAQQANRYSTVRIVMRQQAKERSASVRMVKAHPNEYDRSMRTVAAQQANRCSTVRIVTRQQAKERLAAVRLMQKNTTN